ncbi:MAG: hypothetical protein WC360_04120 [Opitutales bacterium]
MNLNSLSWDTVLKYNLSNAFAIPKSALTDGASFKFKTVNTTSYRESLGLLNSLSGKLGTVKTNLQMMLNTALKGSKTYSSNTKAHAEAYAQLRSLSAGIDTVVRDYKVEGTPLLDGRSYKLSYGNGSLTMNLDNLSSSAKDGLGLASAPEGAFAKIGYDSLALMKNSASDIVGLDITDAKAATVNLQQYPYTGQLADGDYWMKVTYMGANSVVELQKMDGSTVEKIEGVDLSGTGQVSVKTNSGVELSFEKTYFKTALGGDKHDYDLFGPQSLYANLHYERNVQHVLDDGSDKTLQNENNVSVIRGSTISGTTGSLKVGATTAPVYDGVTTMKTGQYDLKIRYDGQKSSVWLYDPSGTLVSTRRNVNLAGEDPVSVDMGTGVAFSFDPANFTSTNRDYHSYISYTAADVPSDELDFGDYYDRIAAALSTVQEQMDVVAQAQDELQSRYSIVQNAMKLSSSLASASSSLSNILGGTSADAASLFGSINYASLSGGTNGQMLLSSGNIIGALQESVNSMANVDPSILALYYR